MSDFVVSYFKGVSKGLLGIYLFLSPFLIPDEMLRLNEDLVIGKLFIVALAIVKILFGMCLLFFQAETYELTKFVCTAILLGGFVLHADIFKQNDATLFKNVYAPTSESSYLEMTTRVKKMHVNDPDLQMFFWALLVGIVASISFHSQIPKMDFIGRSSFIVFSAMYGIGLIVSNDFSRAFEYFFSGMAFFQEDPYTYARFLAIYAFLMICAGVCVFAPGRNRRKWGSLLAMVLIAPQLVYEGRILLIAFWRSNLADSKLRKASIDQNFEALANRERMCVYPIGFQTIRAMYWAVIFSGILFHFIELFEKGSEIDKTGKMVIENGEKSAKKSVWEKQGSSAVRQRKTSQNRKDK